MCASTNRKCRVTFGDLVEYYEKKRPVPYKMASKRYEYSSQRRHEMQQSVMMASPTSVICPSSPCQYWLIAKWVLRAELQWLTSASRSTLWHFVARPNGATATDFHDSRGWLGETVTRISTQIINGQGSKVGQSFSQDMR